MNKVLLSAAAFALVAGFASADIVLDDYNTVEPYDGDAAIWASPAITDHAVITQEANGFSGNCLKCVYSYNGAAVTGSGYHDWRHVTKTFEEPLNLNNVSGFSLKMKVENPTSYMRIMWDLEDIAGGVMRIYESDANLNFTAGEWRNVLLPLCQASKDIPQVSTYPQGLHPSQWLSSGRPINLAQIKKVRFHMADLDPVTVDGTVTFYLDDFVAIEDPTGLNETTLWDAEDFADTAAVNTMLTKLHATQTDLALGTASDGSKCVDCHFTYVRWGGFGVKLAADLTTPLDLSGAAYIKAVFETDPAIDADTSSRGYPMLFDTPGVVQPASRAIPYYANTTLNAGGKESCTFVPFNNPAGIGWGSQYTYTWCSAWAADAAGKIDLTNICNILLQFDTNMAADFPTVTHKLKRVVIGDTANTPGGPASVNDWSLM